METPYEGKGHDGRANRYSSPLVCTTDMIGCICTCLTMPAELNEAFFPIWKLEIIMPSVAMNRVEPNSSSRLICLSGLEQNLSGLEPSCPIWVRHHTLSVACVKLWLERITTGNFHNQAKPRLETSACGNWNTMELTAAITVKYVEESWK